MQQNTQATVHYSKRTINRSGRMEELLIHRRKYPQVIVTVAIPSYGDATLPLRLVILLEYHEFL